MIALWPPAAAISSARRACDWPRTSEKSTAVVTSGSGTTVAPPHAGRHVPRRYATASPSVWTPTTSRSRTNAASGALATGTTTPARPSRRAATATERIPGVGTSEPRRASSPANANRLAASAGTWAEARRTLIATGRSSPGPSLRRLPGDRLTTTRRSGHSSRALSIAGRIRSRASCTAAPGWPVSVSDGSPRPMCASTATGCPRTPTTVTPTTRPYTVARP